MATPIDVLARLASSLGCRDQVLNQELAQEILQTGDTAAIQVLVDNLQHRQQAIRNDCIKVLYEIGAVQPALIADHTESLQVLLEGKNNRLQWGAMTALAYICRVRPAAIHALLPSILKAVDTSSVITRDQAVNILIELNGHPEFSETAFSLLIEQLLTCPTNQLPMYAERALLSISDTQGQPFREVLSNRLDEIEKESKRKRVEKVIRKVAASAG